MWRPFWCPARNAPVKKVQVEVNCDAPSSDQHSEQITLQAIWNGLDTRNVTIAFGFNNLSLQSSTLSSELHDHLARYHVPFPPSPPNY